MAKTNGVPGWHTMRKEQLIRALVAIARQKQETKSKGIAVRSKSAKSLGAATPSNLKSREHNDSRIARKLRIERHQRENLKNLAFVNQREHSSSEPKKDRVILIVREPYWIQAYWEITQTTSDRVRVALADVWFETSPVLRLLEVSVGASTSSVETVVRQIPIHGGVRNWYIDVPDPPKSYRVALGYATASGKFHLIAKSNLVTTPTPDHGAFDLNWSDIQSDYKRVYAMSGGYSNMDETGNQLQLVFEEKLRRPMNVPAFVEMGNGINNDNQSFDFEVDAHMVVHGKANPNANVTLAGEPIEMRVDGSFAVRLEMPDKRQVLPIVARSRDGTQQQTTVLSIERNTKVMEPISRQLEEVDH